MLTSLRLSIAAVTISLAFGSLASAQLSGTVSADGSSTVGPITMAIAEEFEKENPKVKPTIGISGTGGGFKRFTSGETDLSNASRPIKKEEADIA
jgi:phosphate transport system substrate-binding protein